jgi:hypothetical protein
MALRGFAVVEMGGDTFGGLDGAGREEIGIQLGGGVHNVKRRLQGVRTLDDVVAARVLLEADDTGGAESFFSGLLAEEDGGVADAGVKQCVCSRKVGLGLRPVILRVGPLHQPRITTFGLVTVFFFRHGFKVRQGTEVFLLGFKPLGEQMQVQ